MSNPRVIRVRLEETRQEVDCLLLKDPTSSIDFQILYGKRPAPKKAKQINQGAHLGWAKVMQSNQFISFCYVKYQTDSEGSALPEGQNRVEAHELPHALATVYFGKHSVKSLLQHNNIRPQKVKKNTPAATTATSDNNNTSSEPPKPIIRIPIVPSFMYAQKRLYIKWRFDIVLWWSRNYRRYADKKSNQHLLLQLFTRAYPEFRSVTSSKQWFFQIIKRCDEDIQQKKSTFDKMLEQYGAEVQMMRELTTNAKSFVLPASERVSDTARQETAQALRRLVGASTAAKSTTQTEQDSSDDSDSSDDDSDDDSDSDDSDDDDDESDDESTPASTTKNQVGAQDLSKKPVVHQRNFDDSDSESDSDSDSDSDSESEEPAPPQQKQQVKQQQPQQSKQQTIPAKKATIPPPAASSSSSDSDSDEHDRPQPVKRTIRQLQASGAAAKAVKAGRRNFDESDQDSDSDDDEPPAPVKRQKPTTTTRAKPQSVKR